ncbi:uncharacterized protein LOC100827070 [Brachypodium distachyon]|nr:uncharacterized protein LOC100827070 [Brachypodium distachyon]XP_024317902.1 uncharacterized protein LOC100827070 [Brachypodium distachyon]|eukprot:XP_003570122.1 uncharacterized protein LOC100827070 [Brachypodium distachyon]
MEFNSSYFHAFGNPDFAAVFSGGSAQALRPSPGDGAGAGAAAKAEKGAARQSPTNSPVASFVPDEDQLGGEAQHFLNECSRCRRSLTGDIFMYRGDTPFCSEECRRRHIETEKTRHRRKKQNSPKALAQALAQRENAPQLRRPQPR